MERPSFRRHPWLCQIALCPHPFLPALLVVVPFSFWYTDRHGKAFAFTRLPHLCQRQA